MANEITSYMTRNGFGDYSRACFSTREEMEDAALEFAAREQGSSTIFAEIGIEGSRARYAEGTADANDIRSLLAFSDISIVDAEAYYIASGWQLPKFGLR